MKTQLTGDAAFIDIDENGIQISAPGLTGKIHTGPKENVASRGLRGSSDPDPIQTILEDAEMSLLQTVDMELEPQAASRSLRGAESSIVKIKVRQDNEKGYAALYYDDENGYSWIFPNEVSTRSLTPELVFDIPVKPTEDDSSARSRGLTKGAFRTIVNIIAWATKGFIGKKGKQIIEKWETKKRPYKFVAMPPGKLEKKDTLKEIDWDVFRQGERGLLFIHGTFSTIEGSYGHLLASEEYKELHARYGGRVVGFNHPSLKDTPEENMQMFFKKLKKELPSEITLNVDMITSSRGGLVGRNIIRVLDQSPDGDFPLKINRAILVAPPNRGSELANVDRWKDLINRYTNLTRWIPGNPGLAIIDGVVALIKILGLPVVDKLPGLQAMVPGNDSLRRLNQFVESKSAFYTLGAAFEPEGKGLKKLFRKAGEATIDTFFGEESDTVVPTHGTYNSSQDRFASNDPTQTPQFGFFVEEHHRALFTNEKGMHHLNYFKHSQVNQKLLVWLEPVESTIV